MSGQKSAKRASIDMLKQFERDIERFQEKTARVQEWGRRVIDSVGLEPTVAVGDLAQGATQVKTVRRVIEWLKHEEADWAIPTPTRRFSRNVTKKSTLE